MEKLLTEAVPNAEMNCLSKLLVKIKLSKGLLNNKNACFICSFTKSQYTKMKKLALEKNLIEKNGSEYQITDRGSKFLKNCPYKNWQCSTYSMRPPLNLEFLKSDRVSSNITRYAKEVQRYLLENIEPAKNSIEDFIIQEILDDKSAFIDIKKTIEKDILSDIRVNIATIFEMYQKPPYGLTKSIICLLVSKIITQNKDKLAIFEKDIFVLNLNINILNKIYYCPQNFEIQKTAFEHPVIKRLSIIVSGKNNSNILDLTHSLILRILNLDKYTLNTKSLSKNTLKFRNIILSSKDPINLFKVELPLALCKSGFDGINNSYYSKFKDCL